MSRAEEIADSITASFREAEARALKSFLIWLGDQGILQPSDYSRVEIVRQYQAQRPDLPPSKQEAEQRLDQHGLVTSCVAPGGSIPATSQAANILDRVAAQLSRSRDSIEWVHKLPNDDPYEPRHTYLVGLKNTNRLEWVIL